MRIEQLLHGYDNGHRLLAGSVLLKNNADMDAIATLSDWSEYVAPGDGDSSYVTAYPLVESSYYVIAKTWYAEEMRSPGCVWTHSLLIPFDTLNSLDNFRRISSLFVRPDAESSYDNYSHTIKYENKNYLPNEYEPLTEDREKTTTILLSMINADSKDVMMRAVKNNQTVEKLLLSVMNILPLAMLKHVSWCTGTAYLRKLYGKSLKCQYLSRSINEDVLGTDYETDKSWINYIVDGLLRGDINQGQLIRMFAEDISSIDNYAAIVKVLYTLEDYFKEETDKVKRYKTVLEIIVSAFPTSNEGHIIKKLCTKKVFSDRYCSDKTFFYLYGTLPLDDVFDEVETRMDERWNEFFENNRQEYVPLISQICNSGNVNSWGVNLLKGSAIVMTPEEVAGIIKSNFHLFSSIALLNKSILGRLQLQELTPQEIESVLPIILDNRTQDGFTQWEQLFILLLEHGIEICESLAKLIFTKSGNATKILLDFVNKDDARYVNRVLGIEMGKQTKDVLNWLSSVEIITDKVAYAIVNSVNELSSEVVDAGAKIWRPFLGLQFHQLRIEVYTYLFALSFNWPSDRDAIQLMQMSFYPLHILEANNKLGYGNWGRIAKYMETVMFWDEWDNCKKLRKTVVKRLKRAGMGKNVLEYFTPDRELNELMMKMW